MSQLPVPRRAQEIPRQQSREVVLESGVRLGVDEEDLAQREDFPKQIEQPGHQTADVDFGALDGCFEGGCRERADRAAAQPALDRLENIRLQLLRRSERRGERTELAQLAQVLFQ